MAKEMYLKRINTRLIELEENPYRTQKEIDSIREEFKLFLKLESYSEEELGDLVERLNALSVREKSISKEKVAPVNDKQRLSLISPKSLKLSKKAKILLTAAIVTAALGTAGCSLTSYFTKEDTDTVSENAVSGNTVSGNTVSENTIVYTEMSLETKEYADEIVDSMNNAIAHGFEVTDVNKEVMAKKFINYMNIIKMNELTAEQWKALYQDGNITSKDMMHDLFDIETIFEKIITVSENKDEAIDFSLYFKDADAELLSNAEDMIIKINTSSGKERTTAIKEMHDSIIDTLTITESRMQYSEVALNTFRGVFVNAFDVLSNGKSITDEEEHAIFTVSSECMNIDNNDMNVEDHTIKSLQSKYEIYMVEKIDTMLNKDLDIEVNPYDSINEVSKYVADKIDISLYKPAKDYEEYQEKLFLSNTKPLTVKSKDDSGVSNGKGGVISNKQLEKYGINPSSPTAKADLEAAVRKEYEQQAEKDKVTTDLNGTVVDAELLQRYTQQGADDYNYNRGYNVSSISALYQSSYRNGWDSAKAAADAVKANLQPPANTYEPVTNGSTTTVQESITEQPYTGDVNTPSEPLQTPDTTLEEFEPIGSTTTTEEVQTIDYQSSINMLEQMRKELLDLSNIYTNDSSKSKC